MKDVFVIKVGHGGLGDHLFYSHLPRIAKIAAGYSRVYISNRSTYRHPAYQALIWETNPYVDGFCDEDAFYPESFPDPLSAGMNLLDRIMLAQGLDDGIRFHEPELYLQTAPLPELTEATVYDPNFVSGVGEITSENISHYFNRQHIHVDYMLKPRERSVPVRVFDHVLETEDVWHYCRVIHSCRRFYCLTSGGATLAAALQKPSVALYGQGQNSMFHHSRLHEYINVSREPSLRKMRRYLGQRRRDLARLVKREI